MKKREREGHREMVYRCIFEHKHAGHSEIPLRVQRLACWLAGRPDNII